MSEDHLRTLALEVRNWARGVPTTRSGIGTLNDISPEAIAAAARLATTGKVFALGISLQREGPQRRRGLHARQVADRRRQQLRRGGQTFGDRRLS